MSDRRYAGITLVFIGLVPYLVRFLAEDPDTAFWFTRTIAAETGAGQSAAALIVVFVSFACITAGLWLTLRSGRR